MYGVSNDAIVYFGLFNSLPNISESDGDVGDSNIEPLRRPLLSWLPVVDVGFIFIIA